MLHCRGLSATNFGIKAIGTRIKMRKDETLKVALNRTERAAVEKVLAQTNGNVAEAAVKLGILRTSLYRIMKRCGIASPTRTRK
jgi:transcriptional regulator with PAS, ATPase and Fis domain